MPFTYQPVMNSRSAAAANAAFLSERVLDGRPFDLPEGTLYVYSQGVPASATRDCAFSGQLRSVDAGTGISLDGHPTLTGHASRIVQLGTGPILRLRGLGFQAERPVEVVQAPETDAQKNGQWAATEIEGRATPPTGRHSFAKLLFQNWAVPFHALAGYYDKDGKFVKDENHADNCLVKACETFNCGGLFRSDNEQAVQWRFTENCKINGRRSDFSDFCIADLRRGGCLGLHGLTFEDSRIVIFRLKEFSPNASRLYCTDFYWDRILDPSANLCLVEYVGDPVAATWSRWQLTIEGYTCTQNKPIEQHELFRGTDKLPKDDWEIKIRHVVQKLTA